MALKISLFALLLLAQAPGASDATPAPAAPAYFELLESNTHIIYPLLALVVLVLLAVGIVHAWRSEDLDGLVKAELKRTIILELRRQVGGTSAEKLSRVVGLEPLKLVHILEEMQDDGLLTSHTNTQRLTVWQVKGAPAPRRK